MSKPQIILVPGAWHAPFCMASLSSKLESLGYTVHARQLPGVGSTNPPKDLSEDVAALRSLVDEAIGTDNDVVVICHSWGGIVTGSALVGYSQQAREKEGKKGGVIRAGYMAAFMAPEGKCLIDMIGGTYPPWFDVQVCRDFFTKSHLSAKRTAGALRLRHRSQHLLQRPRRVGATALACKTAVPDSRYVPCTCYGRELDDYSGELSAV